MTGKQRVTFRFADTGSGSPTGYGADLLNLAVEVHDATSAVAGRGTLGSGVELEQGRDYFISTTLPDGTRVTTHTKLEPNTTEVVLSEPAGYRAPSLSGPAEESSDAGELAGDAVTAGMKSISEAPLAGEGGRRESTELNTVAAPWRVAGFSGNLLANQRAFFGLTRLGTGASQPDAAGTYLDRWSIDFQPGGPTYIQLKQPKRPVWNYAVPLGPGERCVIQLIRQGADFAIDMKLPNSNADLLLRYVGNNLLQEAAQTVESPSILAQDLLGAKFEHPIGAAIGAYALLRRGELDRLHDWTKNLYSFFPWLPDGVVILAEHLARVGKHEEALAKLLELPQRGLPLFSSGLTYVLNRLRQYKRAVEEHKLTGDIKSVNALGGALGRYAGYIDVTRPILTFMGTDPVKPSHRPGSTANRQ